MNPPLLLCGLLLAQPLAEPPIAGRPTDWSGAVGGPYSVAVFAQPTELAAEEQLTLMVRIGTTDAGNLATVKRPALAKLEAFKAFAVEDLDDYSEGNPPYRWFRYLLRPRNADVKEIPRLKFVYFSPRTGRYQTTYSEPVPLTVRPRTAPIPAVEVPPWIMEEWKAEENETFEDACRMLAKSPRSVDYWWDKFASAAGVSSNRWFERLYARRGNSNMTAFALIVPPLLGAAWYAVWRRQNPDAARLANTRRSRAAAVALRMLAQAGDDSPRQVRCAIEEYLRARIGLPPSATTPAEVVAYLRGSSSSSADADEIAGLLRRCDDALFAPAPAAATGLVADAERLIIKWDKPS